MDAVQRNYKFSEQKSLPLFVYVTIDKYCPNLSGLTAVSENKECDQTFSLIFFKSRPCARVLRSPRARLFAAFLRLKSSFLAAMRPSVRWRVSADWLTVLGLVVVDSLARRSASRDLLWELRMLSYAPRGNRRRD